MAGAVDRTSAAPVITSPADIDVIGGGAAGQRRPPELLQIPTTTYPLEKTMPRKRQGLRSGKGC